MPNGRSHKNYDDYGPHEYEGHGTSDCKHGCGCWIGPARSGGPLGIDPFGACPDNPIDGKKQPGNDDYEDLVNGRIASLKSGLTEALQAVQLVERARKSTKLDLVKKLEHAEEKLHKYDRLLVDLHQMLQPVLDKIIQSNI